MNNMENLVRTDGTVRSNLDEDQAEVQQFYEQLYTSQGFHQMEELLVVVPPQVTPLMNDELGKPFTEEEVRRALFQTAPSKGPRVYGFTTGFFQCHWNLLKDDIVPAVLDFLNWDNYPRV